MEEARVDKWLWAVRIFKTRSIATDACKKGRVAVGGTVVKPSRMIHIQLLGSRVGAKRVEEFMQNVTPREQYELLELQRVSGFVDRAKGLGRPTKKDRRDLDQFAEEFPEGIEIFDWDEEWD